MSNNDEMLNTAVVLLKEAICPNCGGDGYVIREITGSGTQWVDDGTGNPYPVEVPIQDFEQEPCEWCNIKDQLIEEYDRINGKTDHGDVSGS